MSTSELSPTGRYCDYTLATGDECGRPAIVEIDVVVPARDGQLINGYCCPGCLADYVVWASDNAGAIIVRKLAPRAPDPAELAYARAVEHCAFFGADAPAALTSVALGHTLGWSADHCAAKCECGWQFGAHTSDVQYVAMQARAHAYRALRASRTPA